MGSRETPFLRATLERSPSPSVGMMPSLKPVFNDDSFASRRPSSSSNGTALPSSGGGGSTAGTLTEVSGGSPNVVVVSVMVPTVRSNSTVSVGGGPPALRALENPADVHLFEGAFMNSKVRGYIEKESMIHDDSFTLIDFSSGGVAKTKTAATVAKAGSGHSQLSRLKIPNAAPSTVSLSANQYWNEVCQLCCLEYEGRLRLYRSWLEVVNKIFMVKHVIVELVPKSQEKTPVIVRHRSVHQIKKLNRYWELLHSCTMETQLVWAVELYDRVYTPSIQTYQFPVDKRNSLSMSSSNSYGNAAGVAGSSGASQYHSIWACYFAMMKNVLEFTSTVSRLEAEGGENMMKLLLPATVNTGFRSCAQSPKSMKDLSRQADGVDRSSGNLNDITSTGSVLQRLLYENNSLGDCPIPYHLLLPSPDASWNSMLRLSKRWIIYACVRDTSSKPLPNLSISKTPLTDVERRLHVLQDLERTGRESLTEIFLESLVILASIPLCYQKVVVPARYAAILPDMIFPFPAAPTNNSPTTVTDERAPAPTVSPNVPSAFQPSYLENSLMMLQMDTSRGQHPGGSLIASSFFHNSHLNRSVISPNTGSDRPFASMGRCDGEFMSITTLDSGRESLADISLDASLRYFSITSPKKALSVKSHTGPAANVIGDPSSLSRSRSKHSSHNLLHLGQTVKASSPSHFSTGTPTMDIAHHSLQGEGPDIGRRSMNWMNLARSLSVLDQNPALGALWPTRASGQVSQHYFGLGSSINPGNSSLRPPSSMYSFQNPPNLPSLFSNSRDESSMNLLFSFEKVSRAVVERREVFARLIIRKKAGFMRSQVITVKLLKHSLDHTRGIAIVRAAPRIRLLWNQVEEEKMLMVYQLMREIELTVLEYRATATMMQEVEIHQRFLNDMSREWDMLKVMGRSEKQEKSSGGAPGRPVSNNSRLHGSSGKSGAFRPFPNNSSVELMPMNSFSAASPNSRRLNIPHGPNWAAGGGIGALDFTGIGLGLGEEQRHTGPSDGARFMVNHHFLSTPENSRHFPENSPLLKMIGTPNFTRLPVPPPTSGNALLGDLDIPSKAPVSPNTPSSPPHPMRNPPSNRTPSGTFRRSSSTENATSSTHPSGVQGGFSPMMSQQEFLASATPLQLLNLNSRIIPCFQGIEENPIGKFYGYLDNIPTNPGSNPDAFFKALNTLHAISSEIKNYVSEHSGDRRRSSISSSFMGNAKAVKMKQIIYPNGDSYEGGWLNGERHLLGVYSFGQVGFWYAGGWQRNVPNGDGVLLRISVENISASASRQNSSEGVSPPFQMLTSSKSGSVGENEKKTFDHNFEFLQVLMEQLRRRQEGLPPIPTPKDKPRPAVHIVFGSWTRGELSKVVAVFCNLTK